MKPDQVNAILKKRTELCTKDNKITFDLARALLLSNSWGRKEVIDALAGDKNYIMNTFKYDPKVQIKVKLNSPKKDAKLQCGVCYEESSGSEIVTISECGHHACNECVKDYCKAKITMGNDVVYTRCVACKFPMPESIFKDALSDDEY